MNIGVQTIVAFFGALVLSPAIHARDFDCTSPGFVGVTCLTRAIIEANAQGGVDSIFLGEGSYVLFEAEDGATGLPSITSTLTLMGKGPGSTTISRAPNA